MPETPGSLLADTITEMTQQGLFDLLNRRYYIKFIEDERPRRDTIEDGRNHGGDDIQPIYLSSILPTGLPESFQIQ